ncbi:LuxR family transcriptional regulator [Streptomyces sp. BR123]|uniref:ATP-binding protein n=1 Tax=Streptomyces sp. BR123 TaxID=2749828 RepID=UPI0015C41D76|nr:LuxR C-terminal-related transcriptional regulator [Streptomyces sp. BR123]NXY93605.1 LuxR family transcriptional regulator [Streptomyces sp. BR123]
MPLPVPAPILAPLPEELTSFVGRRRETGELRRVLETSRLVTVVGAGGIGKSRLACRTAGRLARAFPGGIHYADCTDGEEALAHALTAAPDARALLVADNCEATRVSVARLVGQALRSSTAWHVLVTSRQVLGVPGEHVYQLPPLDLPTAEERSTVRIGACDAIALLLERVRAVLSGFALTHENASHLVELCRRLDGLPMALEAAAAQMRVLAPRQVLDRVVSSYDVFARGIGPAAPGLLACAQRSAELCSPEERELWANLSVFRGPVTLDAATAVGPAGADPETTLHLIAGLVDKSVLVREDTRDTVGYRLYAPLRHHGHRMLQGSGGTLRARRLHRDHQLRITEAEAVRTMRNTPDAAWPPSHVDGAELRAALEACLTDPEAGDEGLRLAVARWPYWQAEGATAEACHWLECFVRSAGDLQVTQTVAYAHALWVLAWLRGAQGESRKARAVLRHGGAVARRRADASAAAHTAFVQGALDLHDGDAAAAVAVLREALERLTEPEDAFGGMMAALHLSLALGQTGADDHQALLIAEHCRTQYRMPRWKGYPNWVLAAEALRQGNVDGAHASALEALQSFLAVEDRPATAAALELLARTAAAWGDDRQAARLLGAAAGHGPDVPASARLLSTAAIRDHHSGLCASVRRNLGPRAFEAALTEGGAADLGELLGSSLVPVPHHRGRESADGTGGPLTPRQWAVARLVAEGLSNREIAGRLVVAQRTVETHVEHILARLSFTSRVQIAAWVTERVGLPGVPDAAQPAQPSMVRRSPVRLARQVRRALQ